MTINSFTVYAILQADSIRLGIIILALCYAAYRGCIGLLGILLTIAYAKEVEDEKKERTPDQSKIDASTAKKLEADKKTKRQIRKAAIWFAVAIAAMAFIPTSRTLAASYLAPHIANSVAIQRDFPELYALAVGKLKEKLESAK